MRRKRILLCEFSEESNSFNPMIWDEARFRNTLLTHGLGMRLVFRLIRSPVQGMMDAVRQAGGLSRCGLAYRSMSGGAVADAVVDTFIGGVTRLVAKGRYDGVFLSLHGATVSKSDPDVCGQIVHAVREAAGKDAVIALALDLHANLTRRMRLDADVICGFQTYPHIDLYETGFRAASLGMRKLRGETLSTAYTRVPMIVSAAGYTTAEGPCRALMEDGFARVKAGEIADFSVFQMQPWLDVPDASSTAAVVAKDAAAARIAADALAAHLWRIRRALEPKLLSVDDILTRAEQNTAGRPIVLGDGADSPNAGAVGDSVLVPLRLQARGLELKTLTFVTDPAAAERAHRLGVGAEELFSLGAGFTPGASGPFVARCRVVSLHDGFFRLAGPAGKGMRLCIGKSAVLRTGSMDILVCCTPGGTGDLNFYRGFGLDPADYRLVVVKACTSFRETYASLAAEILVADSEGAAANDLGRLPFSRIPRIGFYPFDPATRTDGGA